jgi:ABC-type dipeptide/oligopeptide/nickel transport system permease subunit
LAAKAIGASNRRIIFKHIFPGTLPILIIHATFSLAGVIIIEASLGFLGLGGSAMSASWGTLLAQGKNALFDAPHLSIYPGLAILLVVLALNFMGDALRDALDPRSNKYD